FDTLPSAGELQAISYLIVMHIVAERVSPGGIRTTPGFETNGPSKSVGLAVPSQGSMQRKREPGFVQMPSSRTPSQATSRRGQVGAATHRAAGDMVHDDGVGHEQILA